MKRAIYGTILLFIAIMVIVMIVASRTPIVEVEYRDGVVVELAE